jgi:hypothetical protein
MSRARLLTAGPVAILAAVSIGAIPAHAATIDVPGNFPTIQGAINAAANGDTVVVEPGTYFENIDFKGKLITVRSAQGSGVTTIDGGGLAPVVNFSNAETTAAVLQGFTLQHGNGTASFTYAGGGIHIYNASPTVQNNVVTANQACASGNGIDVSFSSAVIRDNTITGNSIAGCSGNWGGGIHVGGAASAQIIHNTITNNSSDFGGGLALFAAGTPTVMDNVVSGNRATTWGGGIVGVNQSDATLVQNLITGNTAAQEGGGIYWTVPSGTRGPVFVNNTASGNSGPDASVTLGGFDGQVQLFNNIFAASTTQPTVLCDTTYSSSPPAFDHNDLFNSVGSAAGGSCANFLASGSNISADPTFVGASDYHLATGSPAIDAGNNAAPALPATDLEGKPRVSGPAVDLGVYEFQRQPPLAVTANALPGSTEGASFSGVVGQFTGGVGPYSASIAWGDGQTSAGTIGAGNSVSGGHAYAEEGSYAVSLTVTDSTGASASATTSANTVDAAISLVGTRLTVRSRTTFTARVATLTDADPGGVASDYSGQISWGDGSVTACPSTACSITTLTGGGFGVNGKHYYSRSKTYTATIQIKDAGGSSSTTTTTIVAQSGD